MKIFVGRIDPSLTKRDLEEYFDRYGRVQELKLFEREKYGFVTFEEPFNPDRLLRYKDHTIGSASFIVEMSREQRRHPADREGLDGYSTRDSYASRDGYGPRDGYDSRDSYSRRDEYDSDRYGSRSGYDRRDDMRQSHGRSRCEHCDRCPTHGVPGMREGLPNGHLKIVIENIGPEVVNGDLEKFAIAHGFTPTFVKARGDSAFIEFASVAEKDEGLKKLDGKPITVQRDGQEKSYAVKTRSYITPSQFHRERVMKKRKIEETDAPPRSNEVDPRVNQLFEDSTDKNDPQCNKSAAADAENNDS